MASTDSSVAEARNEQVFTIATSASSAESDSSKPAASKSARMRSESTSFLAQPSVTMSYDDESRTVSFTLPAMSGRAFPGKQATDKVYAVFVESELMQAYTVELGTRGDGGMTSEPLEEGWNKETTHVYVYATDEKGKETSTSRHLSFE